jgi:hypothetical protein
MFGRLFRLSRTEARRPASELLQRFELADAANRTAKTYSGGMRRRLDVASSMLTQPSVLFLDEPTTGLHRCSAVCRSRGSAGQLQEDLVERRPTLASGISASSYGPGWSRSQGECGCSMLRRTGSQRAGHPIIGHRNTRYSVVSAPRFRAVDELGGCERKSPACKVFAQSGDFTSLTLLNRRLIVDRRP